MISLNSQGSFLVKEINNNLIRYWAISGKLQKDIKSMRTSKIIPKRGLNIYHKEYFTQKTFFNHLKNK